MPVHRYTSWVYCPPHDDTLTLLHPVTHGQRIKQNYEFPRSYIADAPLPVGGGRRGGWGRSGAGLGLARSVVLEYGADLKIPYSVLEYGAGEIFRTGVRSTEFESGADSYWSTEFESGMNSVLGSENRAPDRTPYSSSVLRTGVRNLCPK